MKKFTLLLSSIFIIFAVVGAIAQVPEIGVGLGASYPDAPGKVGFDSAVKFDYKLNKLFAVGIESGFGWVNWEQKLISGYIGTPPIPTYKVTNTNLYSVPVLAGVTLNIPFGDSPVSIFVSGKAGYSWTFYSGEESSTYRGFTWQALAGLAYAFDEEYNRMKLFGEIGYRGTSVKSKGEEIEMSAPFARIGVAFPLGYSDD